MADGGPKDLVSRRDALKRAFLGAAGAALMGRGLVGLPGVTITTRASGGNQQLTRILGGGTSDSRIAVEVRHRGLGGADADSVFYRHGDSNSYGDGISHPDDRCYTDRNSDDESPGARRTSAAAVSACKESYTAW